ncbi:MAG: hypothetical protein R3C68_16950 [Myxococcota bacterium]
MAAFGKLEGRATPWRGQPEPSHLTGPISSCLYYRWARFARDADFCTSGGCGPLSVGCGEEFSADYRTALGGNHPDCLCIEPNDKGIIAIDVVRGLIKRLSLKSVESSVKVVLVNHADSMNDAAQNALLKTLEEPLGSTVFLLVARRYRRLLMTVRSRCQRLRLRPVVAEPSLVDAQKSSVYLRALAGGDTERAQQIEEAGGNEIAERLENLLSEPTTDGLLNLAKDLGGPERHKADLCLGLIEVIVRDRLASEHGVEQASLYGDVGLGAKTDARCLAAVADRLMQLRQLQPFHVNRTLALEGVLMELFGYLHNPGGAHLG